MENKKALQLLNVVVQGDTMPSNCEAIKYAATFDLVLLKIQIEAELQDRTKKEGPLKITLLDNIVINDCITCAKVHMKSEDEPCECYNVIEALKES
jgi:hypothetical protein